jgi:DMSO/TMAO reductase YedYZ heme-binding membrane subunit
MQKPSFIFLLILGAVALLGAYQALFPIPAMTSFVRFFALSAYLLLCVSLIIGPLTIFWPQVFGQVVEPRRAVGIACFVFVALHGLLVIGIRYNWNLSPLVSGLGLIVTVPATIVLLALTLTSSDYAVKMLGPVLWKNVQRFNYLAFVFSSVHFILLSNGLFTAVNGKMFVNIAEVTLLILGLATVALQVAGFIVRRKRMRQMKAGTPADKPTAPSF